MAIDTFLAFLAAAFVLMLIPGPSVMLAVGVSLGSGFRVGFANVCGAVVAVAAQVFVLVLGLTPVLLVASQWFELIRWAGVGYLLYLGLSQLWRSGLAGATVTGPARGISARRAFWHGFGVSALNPKSLLFFAAILPQFLDPTRAATPQLVVMGSTLVACALATTTIWAYFADRLGQLLVSPRALTWRDRIGGSIMIVGGIALALAKR